MKYIAIFLAAGLALAAPAHADDDGGASGCVVIVIGSCADIDVSNGAIGTDEIANGAVTEGKLEAGLKNKINGKADTTYVDGKNAAQDITIAGKANTGDVNTKNAQQDAEIDKKANKTYVDHKNDIQDAKQAWKNHQQDVAIGMNYLWDYHQQGQINALGGTVGDHEIRLDAHDALLSQHAATLSSHSKRLDEQEKGLAIAMAMPDAWLSDKDRFAIAGNIGGFNGETALGFAAIGRINQTWSLNSKLGADTEFKEFGWTLGARAGW
jgi:hypothetical protein